LGKFDGTNLQIAQTGGNESTNIIPAAYHLDAQANEKMTS